MFKKIIIIPFILTLNILTANETYILKEGDTLYSLSRMFKTPLDEIININNIEDLNNLPVGSSIIIPTATNSEDGNSNIEKYIVKKGDTLYSISKRFNLSLSTIMKYNNLKEGDVISLGQVLQLNDVLSSNAPIREEKPVEDNIIVKKDPIDNSVDDSVPYWPVAGEITEYSGRIQGVKIQGNSGDYIKAVSKGKVIWYDSFKGIGKVVLIEGSNGYDYLYGTNENLDVSMGVEISAGERLGRLKEDNTSIIFSVFKNGKPLSNISEAPR